MNKKAQIKLRKTTLHDTKQIHAISLECNFPGWSELDYRNEAVRDNSVILSAEWKTEELVVGFIVGRLTGTPEYDAGVRKYRELDIINIGIKAEFRRQGIGGRLLKEIIESTAEENVGSVWLEVRQSNIGAIKFYQTHGFSEIQIRKGFYANPSDNAVVMKLACSNCHSAAV